MTPTENINPHKWNVLRDVKTPTNKTVTHNIPNTLRYLCGCFADTTGLVINCFSIVYCKKINFNLRSARVRSSH